MTSGTTGTARTTRLMRLFPAAYRRTHGDELAAVYADATAGAARAARLREATDLAGHALRVRLRVTSGEPAGRALASAAPYAVGMAAGHAAMTALWIATGAYFFDPLARDGHGAVELTASALLALTAVGVLLGRWQWARLTAVAGAAATLADVLAHPGDGVVPGLLHAALVLALVLGCPPDLPPVSDQDRRRVAATALLFAVPLVGLRLAVPILVVGATTLTLLVLAGALLVAVAAEGGRHHRAAGVLAASLPWAVAPAYGFVVVEQNLIWIAVAFPLAYTIGWLLHRLRPRTMGSA